jgi:hypothetical protein
MDVGGFEREAGGKGRMSIIIIGQGNSDTLLQISEFRNSMVRSPQTIM